MKSARILALAVLGSTVWNASMFASDIPVTQPVAPGVLVLPFQMLDATPGNAWISEALQQNLATEVARDPAFQIVPTKIPATIDTDAATKAGRDAGATIVTFGSFQTSDSDIRITGYLMDVSTGRIFSAIKTSGSIRQLFILEDHLDEQLNRALANRFPEVAAHMNTSVVPNVITIGATPAASPTVQPPPAQMPTPQTPTAQAPLQTLNYATLPPVLYYANPPTDNTPTYNDEYIPSNYYPDYPQLGAYYYPNYNYGYPVFIGNFNGFHDHHDHFHTGNNDNFPHPTPHNSPSPAPNRPIHAFGYVEPLPAAIPASRFGSMANHR